MNTTDGVKTFEINGKLYELEPFDLDRALKGDTVVSTTNGIVPIAYNERLDYPIVTGNIRLGIATICYKKDGKFISHDKYPTLYMLGKRIPKVGEEVLVLDGNNWKTRIALFIRNEKLITVSKPYEDYFKSNNCFSTSVWSKWIFKDEEKVGTNIDISVTINGKEVSPNTISEETWMNIRKKS